MVCLIWKFSRGGEGGRRATFLPSKTKLDSNDRKNCKRLRVLDSDFTIIIVTPLVGINYISRSKLLTKALPSHSSSNLLMTMPKSDCISL